MQTAGRLDDVDAGTQPEVIRVAEDDPGVELFELFEANAFDSTGRTDRHEHGRLNHPTPRAQPPHPRFTIDSFELEFNRRPNQSLCAFAPLREYFLCFSTILKGVA